MTTEITANELVEALKLERSLIQTKIEDIESIVDCHRKSRGLDPKEELEKHMKRLRELDVLYTERRDSRITVQRAERKYNELMKREK